MVAVSSEDVGRQDRVGLAYVEDDIGDDLVAGGLRNPSSVVLRTFRMQTVGPMLKRVLAAYLDFHPKLAETIDGAIASASELKLPRAVLADLRLVVAKAIGAKGSWSKRDARIDTPIC
eukprot:6490402-Amphidinium_carterae.2